MPPSASPAPGSARTDHRIPRERDRIARPSDRRAYSPHCRRGASAVRPDRRNRSGDPAARTCPARAGERPDSPSPRMTRRDTAYHSPQTGPSRDTRPRRRGAACSRTSSRSENQAGRSAGCIRGRPAVRVREGPRYNTSDRRRARTGTADRPRRRQQIRLCRVTLLPPRRPSPSPRRSPSGSWSTRRGCPARWSCAPCARS